MRYSFIGISCLALSFCNRKYNVTKLKVQLGTFSFQNDLNNTVQFEVHSRIEGKIYIRIIPPNEQFSYTERSADKDAYAIPFWGFSEGEEIEGDTVIIRFKERCTYYRRQSLLEPHLGDGVFDYKSYDNFTNSTLSLEQFALTYTIDSVDLSLSIQCE